VEEAARVAREMGGGIDRTPAQPSHLGRYPACDAGAAGGGVD